MQNDKLHNYIEPLFPHRSDLLMEMERYAEENGVPIMELAGMETVLQLLRLKAPKRILEVGTAIGYSALRFVEAIPDVTVVTIERDVERYELAISNIERAHKASNIHVIKGDALEVSEQVEQSAPFDAIFIDAAKGQYQRFFELYEPMLAENGMIITDNVLFKGLVADDEIQSKRVRSLVSKIDRFNQWLMSHPQYYSVIIPVGDGVAVSIKR